MDLLKAVKSGSLKDVEDAVNTHGIWTDYEALNTALANGNIDIAKFLISQNCRLNRNTNSGFESSPLHKAVELKDVDLIKLLLQKKASTTAITEGGNTPLHLAFIAGLTEIVNVLLDHINESLEVADCKNDFGLSHLHIACTTENSNVIEKYLKTNIRIEDAVNEDSPKWAGYTAYHFAVEYKSSLAIYALSNSKLHRQSMQKDKTGQTPRDLACARLVEYSTITHIMSENRDTGIKSYYFQGRSGIPTCEVVDQPTAFHFACMGDDLHLIKGFLERGAPVNVPVSEWMKLCPLYSPLHFAVESGCKKNVKLLLEYGADVTLVNGYNMTALHLAMYNGDRRVMDSLYSKVNKELNLTDNNHLSYFHIAVAKNDLKLVKKMLDAKQVDVNSQVLVNHRDFSLYTPLHFAVEYHHNDMVKLLVEQGADLNVVSSEGTALQIASDFGTMVNNRYEMFELMLSLGGRADLVVGKSTLLHKIVSQINYNLDYNESWNTDPTDIFYRNSTPLRGYIARVIELGCDVNAKNEKGDTALHIATGRSNFCVRRLLKSGADVNIENNYGRCACNDVQVYHHVQNLKALGWKINPKLDEDCDKLMEYWDKEMKDRKDDSDDEDYSRNSSLMEDYDDMFEVYSRDSRVAVRRPGEIKEMKNVKLDKKASLYDFMRLEGENLGVYANNKVLKSIVEGLDGNDRRFSVYAYLIKLQYGKSQKYAEAKVTRKRSSTSKGTEDVPKRTRVA